MNPPDLNQLPLPLEEEDVHYQFQLSTSIPRPGLISYLPCHNHRHDQQQQQQQERNDRGDAYSAKYWMPSKMRWIKRSMISDQTDATRHTGRVIHGFRDKEKLQHKDSSSNSLTGVIRFCSDCNTTKTPLWRSGPCGPKSLCNACGIRQRKARRAMAAAASGGGLISDKPPTQVKKRRRDKDSSLPYKKRCKNFKAVTSQKKIRTDDIILNMRNSADHRALIPQDDKDAAILLMTLSYGFNASSMVEY
ncbi:protein CYTOKININ-RESPONSIVE GATA TRANSCRIPTION FACTOR 1-like isoform X1 [Typha latifolia]|uniref:protein CYTOKININ-RESPONSIVE GATA TRANSCRIPTION FACTOR 1-like isoform X1 n=1 Tax=Typha latifolia TaxID=4733 RepID=UPI003C2E07E1